MFGLLRRKNAVAETIDEARATLGGIWVTIKNIPCVRVAKNGERIFAYSDFGYEFLTQLQKKLDDTSLTIEKLKAGSTIQTSISLRDYSPIIVEVTGLPASTPRQFDSDLADVLIEAFNSVQLRP